MNAPTRPGPSTARLDAEALALATQWVSARKDVRSRLIKLARANHPAATYMVDPLDQDAWDNSWHGWTDNAVRKLYQYPADLSDERLLGLADATTTTTPRSNP